MKFVSSMLTQKRLKVGNYAVFQSRDQIITDGRPVGHGMIIFMLNLCPIIPPRCLIYTL